MIGLLLWLVLLGTLGFYVGWLIGCIVLALKDRR